ncbi:hypothetical protein [Amycolatopsis sp. CB00013]|uniref:hypothetical protein n=1 Tax=Amycolatopsis sp. CB00013 TaxID=1703945 RepID=UPI0023784F24|nr:hypothetical protein [Amycolatopsis sp. CB00013]
MWWDPAAGRPVSHPLSGHTGPVTAVAFDPVGGLLSTGGHDKTIRMWSNAPLP